MKAKETAVVLIEFQNDFCKEGGKLHGGVKSEISRQNTIPNAAKLAEEARKKGALIIHSPFVFNLSWVKFPAACCDKSELNPKNMILRGLPRRDFISLKFGRWLQADLRY